ncbi:MAG: DUF6502 family protein [Gammaproteobacteria bacterium]|nr:DUF6502 family protein [Gammaproteobacteria bacterium]
MPNPIQEKILQGMYGVMRSICRLLLRHEIGYREFSNLAKVAFVQVATEEYGIRGRPTNISRVALMTGLTRKEVKRLRDLDTMFDSEFLSRRNLLAELIHYWNTDKQYSDSEGMPKALKFEGPGESFQSLVKRCAGDIPIGAMRTELKRIGAVSETNDGLLVVKTREYLPKGANERLLNGIEYGLRTIAETVDYNGDPRNSLPRPQKFIHSSEVDKDEIPRLEKIIRERIESFSIETDDLLSTAETSQNERSDSRLYSTVGVGVYFYLEE